MHKNPHQNEGSGIKDSIFQSFPGEHAPGPPRGSRAFGTSWENLFRPTPKFLSPYAHGNETKKQKLKSEK